MPCTYLALPFSPCPGAVFSALRTWVSCVRQNLAYAKTVFLPPACVRTPDSDVAYAKLSVLRMKANIWYSYLFFVRKVSRDNALVYGIFTPPQKLAYRWRPLLKHKFFFNQSTQGKIFCHGHHLNVSCQLFSICYNVPPSHAEVKECHNKRSNLSVKYCFSCWET